MAEDDADAPPIPLQEIVAEALALAQETDSGAAATRFLARVQAWATPSVVLAAVRDAVTETGWRVLPELNAGPVPHGAERSLAKLFGEAPPQAPLRPTLVRPTEEVHGARVLDTWVLPWAHASVSGFLVLRGIPRPYPSNLGDAVALLSQPLWPRLVAAQPITPGPEPDRGAMLAALAADAKRLLERAEAELAREHEQQAALELVRKALAEVQTQREQSQAEAAALHERLEAAGREVGDLRPRLEAALAQASEVAAKTADVEARAREREARATESDRARVEVEAERDRLAAEGGELRSRLEAGEKALAELRERLDAAEKQAVETKGAAEPAGVPQGPAGTPDVALETARQQVAELEARASQLSTQAGDAEKARAEAEAERDRVKAEVAELHARVEGIERQAHADRSRADQDRTAFEDRVVTAERARAAAEADRESLRAQANQLWASIESLQRQMKGDTERFDSERMRLDQLRAGVEAERDVVKSALASTVEKTVEAEKRAQELSERWDKTVAGFREAVQALRRTPFVPPTLRVTFGETEKLVEDPSQPHPTKLGRVLFLDRDTPGLERLAPELEDAGLDVLIASYPEEVSFFLKTPEARQLSALVCDVMALRSDQDLATLVKIWRQEAPGVPIFLTFKADSPVEGEKAQRVPTTVTAGYLPRPLQREALVEHVQARRPGRR